ncbi:MAG: sialidase family protein [Gammaproteobacteria bacterium]
MLNKRKTYVTQLFNALFIGALLLTGSATQAAACEDASTVSVHCGNAPSAAVDDQGRLWVAFVQDKHVYVSHSDDYGSQYSTPVKVNPVAEDAEFNGENRPKILVDNNEVYVSWTKKTSPRFTGEIRFSRSVDGGATFSEPRTINDDGLFTGHRFESLYQTESGLLYMTWIDKRDLEASIEAGDDYSGAAVYYAVSRDGGATFSENYRVANHSCECCRIAIAPRGPDNIAIMWRQIFGVTTRDHAIAVLTPEGEMTEMHRASYDEWQINACPHHGPTMIQGDNSDDYHMAWFSNGDAHQGIYYGRFSFADQQPHDVYQVDGGAGAGHPYLASKDGTLFLVWKGFNGMQTDVQLITSDDEGRNWSTPQVLASTVEGSDHPLIVESDSESDSELYLSWKTEESGYVFTPIRKQVTGEFSD